MAVAIIELITNFDEQSHTITLTHDPQLRTISSQVNTVSLAEEATIMLYLHLSAVTPLDHQLSEDGVDIEDAALGDCNYHQTNAELAKTSNIANGALNPSGKAVPCGLYAGMFPINSMGLQFSNGTSIPIRTEHLSVFDYEVRNGDTSQQWTNMEGVQFQQWMEQNAAVELVKKIGEVDGPLEGNITFSIQSTHI